MKERFSSKNHLCEQHYQKDYTDMVTFPFKAREKRVLVFVRASLGESARVCMN